MKLHDPLIEKALSHRVFCRDFKMHIPHAIHQVSRLTRTIVECVRVDGVAGFSITAIGVRRVIGKRGQAHESLR